MAKIKDNGPSLNFTVGGASKALHTTPKVPPTNTPQPTPTGPGKKGTRGKKGVKPPQQTGPTGPRQTASSAQPKDTMDKATRSDATKADSPRNVPAGIKQPNTPDTAAAPPLIQIDPVPEDSPEVLSRIGPDGLPTIVPAHRTRYRQLSARNAQIGSKDAELQTRLVNEKAGEQYGDKWFLKPDPPPPPIVLKPALNNHFSAPETVETRLLQQLQKTPLHNDSSQSLSGEIADPNNTFVQPVDGASGVTRIMGNFVLKGYADQDQAEIEWVGTKLMQLSGEDSPDMLLGSKELRDKVMAVDPDYKQQDVIKHSLNPRRLEPGQPLYNTEHISVEGPLHCLVMPRVYGTNIFNIIEEPKLVSSFKENMDVHIREMSRIAFKDILLGNSDRVLRMCSDRESPPYLPTFEEVEAKGSQMNGGNIMFQTVDGEVLPNSAIAIDNYGHSRNDLNTEEGQQKELAVFEYYLNDIQNTAKCSPKEVLKEQHITSFIVRSLRAGMEDMSTYSGKSPLEMSDEEVLALVQEGILEGWSQIHESADSLDEFLQAAFTEGEDPAEKTLAYTNTVSKKLEILKRTLIPPR
jgi:hypothetical protein